MKAEALKENIPQIENREVARALYRQVEPGISSLLKCMKPLLKSSLWSIS